MSRKYFGTDGIRGRANAHPMTSEIALKVGMAAGLVFTWLGGPAPGDLPNRIAIFRRPLEADFDDVGELRDEIRITVQHELGHYFGLEEDELPF